MLSTKGFIHETLSSSHGVPVERRCRRGRFSDHGLSRFVPYLPGDGKERRTEWIDCSRVATSCP